jgi:hypothetical protein
MIVTEASGDWAVKRVGFFHFGLDWHLPMPSLEDALTKAQREGDISESLIVLPEAFNIGQDYWARSAAPNTDPSILADLQRLCRQFRVVFVAGLIITDPKCSDVYSAAYSIDAVGDPRRLCTKQNNDGRGKPAIDGFAPYYTPHLDDENNPTCHRGLSIAALICMDAYTHTPRCSLNLDRHRSLEVKIAKCPHRVVCVPAHIEEGNGDFARRWPTSHVVVANSHGRERSFSGLGSFVAVTDGQGIPRVQADGECSGAINRVRVVGLL